jgi:RNA polymerase sigma-70 factor (ECF subfamily)
MEGESRSSTSSGSGPTDGALVLAARAGDASAREALFVRHAGWALGLAQRMLGGSDEADDLVQDAFVRALSRLDQLVNPQAFSSWLSAIVVRTAKRRLRRRRLLVRLGLRSAEPFDPDVLISPSAPADVAAELRAVYAAVSSLPGEERLALVLRRVEGMELSDIAEHMQLSLSTVKRRLALAERHLQRITERPER